MGYQNSHDGPSSYDEFTVSGSDLKAKVKAIIREGNVRRVYIKNPEGRTLLEIPVSAGVALTAVAALTAPIVIAVGAIAAMFTQVTIGVERRPDERKLPPA